MPGQKASEARRREDIMRAAYDVAARSGVEALTLRAVAARAAVSHGTVLFHFDRRDALVMALLERVLDATAVLRVPSGVESITRPRDRMRAVLRAEMERLSRDPRHFRLFLEYWALGVRNASIRRRVGAALDGYRRALRLVSEGTTGEKRATRRPLADADALAAVAVSLIHGCALQAVIDPRAFSVGQHFDMAARMLESLVGSGNSARRPGRRR
jgi:AcrR family transcriptional regulator